MRWAIVIGVDEYGSDGMRLTGPVSDALGFRDWACEHGGVPPEHVRLLLGRRGDDPGPDGERAAAPTKDNVVTAIDEVVRAGEGTTPERLYFYFSGHGLTARVAGRDESALILPGFSDLHTDHTLAVRSLAEFFETTAFLDQFMFLDACRNVPWPDREFEIGRWPVPRRRDPGSQPVQQFILYATSPGLTAGETGWPGEAAGTFTGVVMAALAGTEDAKAWSWERSCYEVRWERLTAFVNRTMTGRAGLQPGQDPRTAAVQIPQDTGARGVAGRDRDPPLVSFPGRSFDRVELTVEFVADPPIDPVDVSVLDALGTPVAEAIGVAQATQTFRLPPRTYAVRATAGDLVSRSRVPIELYCERPKVSLRRRRSGTFGRSQ